MNITLEDQITANLYLAAELKEMKENMRIYRSFAVLFLIAAIVSMACLISEVNLPCSL